jgi:hypothetical protein
MHVQSQHVLPACVLVGQFQIHQLERVVFARKVDFRTRVKLLLVFLVKMAKLTETQGAQSAKIVNLADIRMCPPMVDVIIAHWESINQIKLYHIAFRVLVYIRPTPRVL